MAHTRQLRINDVLKQLEKIKSFCGKKVSIVLRDETVVTGILNSVSTEEFIVTNMRAKVMHFQTVNVAEFYFDSLD